MSTTNSHFGSSAREAGFCSFTCPLVSRRRHMGRNRKWVLQDDIQEAVWRTILRGPRPPSHKWEKRSKSDVSRTQPFSGSATEVSGTASAQETAGACQNAIPSVEREDPDAASPDQAMEAARARVVKLRGILATWGEDDDMFPEEGRSKSPGKARSKTKKKKKKNERKHKTGRRGLSSHRYNPQERPVSERIQSTKLFVERKQKRVDKAKETVARAREALASAVVDQEQQEVLLTGKGGWQNFNMRRRPFFPLLRWTRNMHFQMFLSSCGCKAPSFDFSASWRVCVRSIHAFGHINWCSEDPIGNYGVTRTGFQRVACQTDVIKIRFEMNPCWGSFESRAVAQFAG